MNYYALRRLRFILLAALIAFIVLVLAMAVPAGQAQQPTETVAPTATDTAPTPLAVNGVQPNTLPNDTEVEIVVTGSGFVDGAVVVLSNFGGLETTFVSASVLRATVVVGIPAGKYDVRVVNPDASSAVLPAALTVFAAGPSPTPESTATPAPTAFVRPLLVVQSYGASAPQITPGQNLDFEMTLVNAGQATASNVLATFTSGDFVPRETGGVRALGTLTSGQTIRFWQPLFATGDLRGKSTAVLKVTATYTDVNGQSYESVFELTFPVVPQGGGGPAATATPTATATVTPTATPRPRPQLLVTNYRNEPRQLEPGQPFALTLEVANEGETDARSVTLILGGGSDEAAGGDGTPGPGGLSGAGGQFSEFAPIGTSNVSRLGNLAVGERREATQQLIVNTTTDPGAYPLKVSFVYTDNTGASYIDDQVVTLLVLRRPQVEMGFYTSPPTLFAGQPGGLPLQVVNTGRNSAVFGNFSVSAPNSDLTNNAIFVGALEPGGFFPMDALITPFEPGPLDLALSINYTNDFNQPDVITDTLTIEVLEGAPVEPVDPGLEPGAGGEGEAPVEGNGANESLAQRFWRFLLGLLGLGSSPSGNEQPVSEPMPIEAPVGP